MLEFLCGAIATIFLFGGSSRSVYFQTQKTEKPTNPEMIKSKIEFSEKEKTVDELKLTCNDCIYCDKRYEYGWGTVYKYYSAECRLWMNEIYVTDAVCSKFVNKQERNNECI